MVLDEPADDDLVEEHNGVYFIVKESLKEYEYFTVESIKMNGLTYFKVIPGKTLYNDGGCSSCSSCG